MKPEETQLNPSQESLFSFDPVVLLMDACRKWVLVLVAALLVGMAAYVYTDSGYTPRYSTSCTLVLTTRDSAATVYNRLDATSNLATVFTEVLNSSVMRNSVLDALQMDHFNGTIQAKAIESTNLLTLQVTGHDPRTTFQVMRVLLEKHDAITYTVMGDIVLEVLEPPTVPTAPMNRANSFHAFRMAAMLAGVGTFGMLVMLAYFKDVVRSKEEADAKLSCWCLGEIIHERKKRSLKDILLRKKRSILLTDPETSFRFVTTMSKLARRVSQRMHNGQVLLVTSVLENEGKSTVAVNLALALAKKHARVLMVDGDLHKPACRKILEHEPPKYVINDVIRGDAALEDAVCTDKRSRMHVLFAKRCANRDATELLGSEGMEKLLAVARERYDYIVIDLAPMSAVPDTEAVMELADASLLVVRQNMAGVPDLNRAVADLERGRAKLLGCVLNNVHTTAVFSGEGYGVGYGRYGGYGNYGRYGRYGRYGAYAQKQSEE